MAPTVEREQAGLAGHIDRWRLAQQRRAAFQHGEAVQGKGVSDVHDATTRQWGRAQRRERGGDRLPLDGKGERQARVLARAAGHRVDSDDLKVDLVDQLRRGDVDEAETSLALRGRSAEAPQIAAGPSGTPATGGISAGAGEPPARWEPAAVSSCFPFPVAPARGGRVRPWKVASDASSTCSASNRAGGRFSGEALGFDGAPRVGRCPPEEAD